MNKYSNMLLAMVSACVAGCWTFNETPFPETCVTAAPASTNRVSVAVRGFDATLTEQVAVHGYSTVYVPGHFGYRHYHPGYYEVMPMTSYVSQGRTTDVFLQRAKDAIESAGFNIGAQVPDMCVEVRFSGPFSEDSDGTTEAMWMFGTLFFCDFDAQGWSAKLKIRDNRTGELVFTRDYVQRYETNVFGLIPIFGIAACEKTTGTRMQCWCLAALVDRTVADATAFLATRAK